MFTLAAIGWMVAMAGVGSSAQSGSATTWKWDLPPGFPTPRVPADNPMSAEKAELGRHLFYDTRLSIDGTYSCATCHDQAVAFTDRRARSQGVTGHTTPRGSMSLANVAYSPVLTWANPSIRSLEAQALIPMFGENPVEMGLSGREAILIADLKKESRYTPLFAKAYPGDADPFTLGNITKAIATFERTLISGRSPYDRYKSGEDPNAISEAAKQGETLFFSEELECFHCHGSFNFTETVDFAGKGFLEIEFHNTGLYNVGGTGNYPASNTGVHAITNDPDDMGKFKAPSLRNVAVTAPYMHDGSITDLHAVLDHYAAGGRTITTGPNAGVGADNPHKSGFVKKFDMPMMVRHNLMMFLRSLTDDTFLKDPRFSDPWKSTARVVTER
jgi:cytochrome c peroxidase